MTESLTLRLMDMLVRRDDDDDDVTPECPSGNDYDGRIGVRVSAIFVILVTSSLCALFPVASRQSKVHVPEAVNFIAKYFGSGVIIATAFIHLLAPATEALGDECLGGQWTVYPWPIAICMMAIFILFFIEMVTFRFATFDSLGAHTHEASDAHFGHVNTHSEVPTVNDEGAIKMVSTEDANESDVEKQPLFDADSVSAQLAAVFILEFGVIFHSIFIGLSLAVSGEEFNTLYVVLVFHQSFEGLGLGTRLANVSWAPEKQWLPYVLAVAYGLSTPIATAIGLGVRYTYQDSSRTVLITNGIFDSISSGILIYTGLVELMAHEFLFSNEMRQSKFSKVCMAFATVCTGAGIMSLLGRWA
ncbi:Zinc/iron permease [Dipodascopsis uninucleata]